MLEAGPRSDLRARRRVETRTQVSAVALRLFEENGIAATTVDEIAEKSGISPRTFFRHFATKEDAALVGHMDLEEAIDDLDLDVTSPTVVLSRIQDMYAKMLETLADDNREYFMVQQLIAREPALQRAADQRLRVSTERLRARLTDTFGANQVLLARLIVEVTSATLHAALEEWTQQAGAQHATSPAALYRKACQDLQRLTVTQKS